MQRLGYSREWIMPRAVERRMSPALVHGKVDRWLLDHEDWIAQGGATRLALCEDWRKVAVEFGAGHPAALGCLLALVREAYGNPDITTRSQGDDEGETLWDIVTPLRWGSRCIVHGLHSEADALVAALEAALRGELS